MATSTEVAPSPEKTRAKAPPVRYPTSRLANRIVVGFDAPSESDVGHFVELFAQCGIEPGCRCPEHCTTRWPRRRDNARPSMSISVQPSARSMISGSVLAHLREACHTISRSQCRNSSCVGSARFEGL